ncbi:hypothetical protein [Thiothrix nivea]|uniref:Uncharacterized protein n=1 Tax=Thiothrix nivea (strain ATCC 35100 / DSM 5205 / JP2) TaxID=870187 RepID=A0A656HNH9_THINJ|nr:hypothetical protein [Thiothrix nivea]EIJ36595.1 hypothetical protein Thini_4103 [Thiothrix nivea DSM 5205]
MAIPPPVRAQERIPVSKIANDASFVLTRYPKTPILLTSSTIDGYGRAELMEAGETVKERELL